jgi:hypothetical protein
MGHFSLPRSRPDRDGAERRGHGARGEPRRQHPRAELDAAHQFPPDDELVGEVRARQQQRGCVRHEDRAVQERALVQPATPGRVDEHRREEHDGRVEVQHRRHRRDEREQRDEERTRRQRRRRDPSARRLEQAVARRDRADQKQPGDEDERRPRLPRGG